MTFAITDNYKKLWDGARNITVELDYTDSNNKKIICTSAEYNESLLIVDHRNYSCDIYLKKDTKQEIVNILKEALPILGFNADKIFFQGMN